MVKHRGESSKIGQSGPLPQAAAGGLQVQTHSQAVGAAHEECDSEQDECEERLHTKDNGLLQTEVPTSAYRTHSYLQAKIGYKANQTRAAKPTASPLLAVQALLTIALFTKVELPAAPDHSHDYVPLHGTHWYLHLDFFLGGIQPPYVDD
ncbi:hypothetical protein B296_00020310 [Ensete ventricosum]|uniref:Uncharacterized protein n=1 Tax=Ensete ventricosum TaxID=4639 RepID=A0A427A1S6_ENSVE|nr:hypothetical protein B296_00020310 [Ensete ventricosum]